MLELVKEQQEEYTKGVCGCAQWVWILWRIQESGSSVHGVGSDDTRTAQGENWKVTKQGLKDSSLSTLCKKSSNPTTWLSVERSCAHITHLQPNRVADIWKKAESIWSSPNLVVPEAGNACARQVASISGDNCGKGVTPPHFVYSKKLASGVEVHCDCPVFCSTPNTCQYSLAGAEDMDFLNDYLVWVRKTKATALNLSNRISREVPKSASQKGGTSHRKSGPKGKWKQILSEKRWHWMCTYSIFATQST